MYGIYLQVFWNGNGNDADDVYVCPERKKPAAWITDEVCSVAPDMMIVVVVVVFIVRVRGLYAKIKETE